MKKILCVSAVLGMISFTAFAGNYGEAGCGLGSVVIGDKKGFSQVFAATTNGTSGSQTFGITSGTSNCGSGSSSAAIFIEANKVALSNDVVKGEGETLNALAEIYGVSNHTKMGKTLKAQYSKIFASNNATIINKEIKILLKDSSLL